MSEDLQSLLEKINRDGVQKAQAQADEIVAAAKAAAEKASAAYAERTNETIRQAARDIVLDVKKSVDALLCRLLTENVNAALSDPASVRNLVAEAIATFASKGDIEVAASSKLAEALKAQLAAKGNFTVVTDETLETGFSVKVDGGRVEHAFTGMVIAEELAKRLRPDLAALVK